MRISFAYEAVAGFAPLTATLPNNTSIYKRWPPKSLRVDLPKYHRVAAVVPDRSLGNFTLPEHDEHTFMSPPIHVRDGDFLSVSIKNSLQVTGLSLHWHGFEMEDTNQFDGVVGVTQCPISPGASFEYAWEVRETPGTYWYHTHSGELGLNADNAIMGPLIVHPKVDDETSSFSDMPFLDSKIYDNDPFAQQQMPMDDLLFYGNERILFFKDGFLHSGETKNVEMVGGLNPPISYNDDSFGIGTYPWNFGTINGKMREVVPVSPGITYKFRILNAGSMYALRISFDGIKMTIVAADSEQVEPVIADEIIVHAAERFDVEVAIPEDAEIGSTRWIRADTLESRKQGYQNGIRAILHVVDPNKSDKIDSTSVPDPETAIETTIDHSQKLTYNCYSHVETKEKRGEGGCIPVSALRLKDGVTSRAAKIAAEAAFVPYEAHVIDWQFSSNPQFAHFVRIDHGKWNQHAMNHYSMLLPEYTTDGMLHPNAAVLNVEAGVRAILIWRNKSLMDHPIHLHGRKMEILDELIVKKSEACDQTKCRLNDVFASDEALERLASISVGSRPLKDTFVLPAGGVVATRIFTGDPALWFAHCHLESHREDGMALIMNVGNYQAPLDVSWLPPDYPRCDASFLLTKKEFPACDCYIDSDAVMDNALTESHRCSRDYLCFHYNSPQSNLLSYPYESTGIAIKSQYNAPGWAISLLIVLVTAVCSNLIAYRKRLTSKCGNGVTRSEGSEANVDQTSRSSDIMNNGKGRSSRIAVILINVQNEFVDRNGNLHHIVKDGIDDTNAVAKTIELTKVARDNGALIVHATTVSEEGTLCDELQDHFSCDELFTRGSWNADIYPGVFKDGDMIFTTQSPNVFTPELQEYIKANSISELLICGYTLDYNVHKTLIEICMEVDTNKIDIMIVEDCCVASSMENRLKHLYALHAVKIVDQTKAKHLITSSHTVAETKTVTQYASMKRNHVRMSVERELPLTLNIPGRQERRTMLRGPVVIGRTSQVLPTAETYFAVPKRRAQLDIQIEGFTVSGNVNIQADNADVNEQSSFREQFSFLFNSQWLLYRPTSMSLLRFTEVASLAFFTGALFYSIGDDSTATGFGSVNSLLFFSVTLWTFTRMYPSINTHHGWNENLRIISNEHRYCILPYCLARYCVVLLCESGWPFLYVFVCYPLASIAGSWSAMFRIGLMLSFNNICYITIGNALAVVVDKIPKAMIVSTVVAQSSLVAAGFYTEVPSFLAWMRYLSPVYFAYRGIVKSAFTWSDTFKCRWGSTLSGVNQCFIEFHTSINNLKNRNIPVATFGDDQSNRIWLECMVLILLYLTMLLFIIGLAIFRQHREDMWEMFFERLAEYKAIHGDTNVPFDHKSNDGLHLGWFVRLQRRHLKSGKLTDEQVERLEELGFGAKSESEDHNM